MTRWTTCSASYYKALGVKVRYLHADVETLERMAIVRDLRLGVFDVLVGINLLREGLDIPEVSLVAILDADKEGFLRNKTSMIQTIGRAARNVEGRVLLYGDKVTPSMAAAIDETNRRRAVQEAYNVANNITPETIRKAVDSELFELLDGDKVIAPKGKVTPASLPELSAERLPGAIEKMRRDMKDAAKRLDFERAAELRDRIRELEQWALAMTGEDDAAAG